MSNKITDARLEWLEETRRRKSLLIQQLEEEEKKMVEGKDGAAAADDAAVPPEHEVDAKLQETLNSYQLNIDRFKEELAAIEKEFESWQEMGFSLPAGK
ncbi:hypothetical protein BBK36DRAFT_1127236 [Trichoderma citrinoviride]|uniref:Uncharacterized protein n=1 Tax=Trichoderma citrinoviride TaxID=58853 RepID=A0A2T4B1B7_9HYPO|nr:hypothetical protein BBK36DRAFT_1127236 [Trichoderma citrinoviride]PTB63104.1 hypothetical protein BBK36DRAFT_1127236 [Trichoderma citrinoviride]